MTEIVKVEAHIGLDETVDGTQLVDWHGSNNSNDAQQLVDVDQPRLKLNAYLNHDAVEMDATEFMTFLAGIGDIGTSSYTLTTVTLNGDQAASRYHVRKTGALFSGFKGLVQYFNGAEQLVAITGDGSARDARTSATIPDLTIPRITTSRFDTVTGKTDLTVNGVLNQPGNSPAGTIFSSISDILALMHLGNDGDSLDGFYFYMAFHDEYRDAAADYIPLAEYYLNPVAPPGPPAQTDPKRLIYGPQ